MGTMIRKFLTVDTLKAGMAELVGTFFLTLAALIAGTPYAVALTLAAFVYAIGTISGCIINPAIAVAMGQALTPGTWAPLVSAVVFTVLFMLVEPKGGPQEQGAGASG